MFRPLLVAALVTVAATPVLAAPRDPATWTAASKARAAPLFAAIAGTQRSDANKARDQYRHPAETLNFFQLKPGMTVVEISPGGGWYTEILAPYLHDKGRFYVAYNDPDAGPQSAASLDRFKTKLAANPAVFGNVQITAFGKGRYDIAPAGSADAVLTFRNVHNWYQAGFAPEAFKAFFAALKDGGVLGIEEHRLPEDRPDDMMKSSGYMKVSYIKKLAADAGFTFVAASEINANPKDTHDYPDGVWTLPPTYQLGDKDKAKYAAIGESDRMTLLFMKGGKGGGSKCRAGCG